MWSRRKRRSLPRAESIEDLERELRGQAIVRVGQTAPADLLDALHAVCHRVDVYEQLPGRRLQTAVMDEVGTQRLDQVRLVTAVVFDQGPEHFVDVGT